MYFFFSFVAWSEDITVSTLKIAEVKDHKGLVENVNRLLRQYRITLDEFGKCGLGIGAKTSGQLIREGAQKPWSQLTEYQKHVFVTMHKWYERRRVNVGLLRRAVAQRRRVAKNAVDTVELTKQIKYLLFTNRIGRPYVVLCI